MFGGRALGGRVPRDAESLIDEARFARDEFLPYWAELWPSGLVLAEQVAALDLAGRRVVELGCGVAVPSVVAAPSGRGLLATDWAPEALAFTRANADARGPALETMLVDWQNAARPESSWRDPAPTSSSEADVLYEERKNGPTLAGLLPRLVAAGRAGADQSRPPPPPRKGGGGGGEKKKERGRCPARPRPAPFDVVAVDVLDQGAKMLPRFVGRGPSPHHGWPSSPTWSPPRCVFAGGRPRLGPPPRSPAVAATAALGDQGNFAATVAKSAPPVRP